MATAPDRNVTSAVCRSTPNGLKDLNAKINQCTSTTELSRNTDFAENTFKLNKDIESLRAMVGDSLVLGDTIYGKTGSAQIVNEVKARNDTLKAQKGKLLTQVDKDEAIIERSNRDFSDVKDTLPETQTTKVLHFIEDYTLAFLSMAYLFMLVSIIYIYTIQSEAMLAGFFKASIGGVIFTIFFYALLYLFC